MTKREIEQILKQLRSLEPLPDAKGGLYSVTHKYVEDGCEKEVTMQIRVPIMTGEIVFYKDNAMIGKLEEIAIKIPGYDWLPKEDVIIKKLYKDMTNRLWDEEELIGHRRAIKYAIEYYEKQLEFADDFNCD